MTRLLLSILLVAQLQGQRVSTGVRVNGRVLDVDQPWDTVAYLTLAGVGLQSRSTVVEADGAFELRDVKPGNYTLFLSPTKGFQSHSILVGSEDVSGIILSYKSVLSEAADRASTNRVAPVVPVASPIDQRILSGRVVFDGLYSNVVPPPVTLRMTRPDGQTVIGPIANGEFRLGLGKGDHKIAILDVPAGSRVKSIVLSPGTSFNALLRELDLLKTPLNVDDVRLTSQIVVTLSSPSNPSRSSRGVTISGQVTGWRERIPSPGRILVVGPEPSDLRQIAVANNGKFALPDVHPGKYTMRVSGLKSSAVEPKIVSVADRRVANVNIHIPIIIDLPGVITVDGGGALPTTTGMTVQTGSESVAVRPDGSFGTRLTDDKRQFSLQGLPPGYYVKAMVLQKTVISSINLPPYNYSPRRTVTTDITGKPISIGRSNLGDTFRLSITLGAR